MIKLTRINQAEFFLNPDHIKTIEEKPDTTIELMNGERLLVREAAEVVVERIVSYRIRIASRIGHPGSEG
mgnify:CR=1 FL=1